MGKSEGRPPKAVKQEVFLGFWVTEVQAFIIRRKVAEARVTLSDFFRQLAINGQVKARWKEEDRKLFKSVVDLANELQTLVRIAEKQGAGDAMLYFMQYRDLIHEILKRMRHDQ